MCESQNEFDDIRPYTDEEAVKAFKALAEHPAVNEISKNLLPDMPETFLADFLRNVKSIDEFQTEVMSRAVQWVLENTAHNFSYDGIEKILQRTGKSVFMSNHRDIILDPAITQAVLYRNGIDTTEICVGDNLLSNQYIEYLIRSNRMIKVIRGIDARSLYLSSQRLSKYIRQAVTSGRSSVWIAQREGRTKNGIDTTEQGLLKMLDMSGTKGFVENFEELDIIPLSISYEYEPCDILKAREQLISRDGKYVKGSREDLVSILTGIRQEKGNIHLNIGDPLTHDEIVEASYWMKNDRYQAIRHAVDMRIIEGYKLWKTNYMAYDMMNGTSKYSEFYTPEDVEAFSAYIERQIDKVDKTLDRGELRDIMLHIYGNPVASKEALAEERKAAAEASSEAPAES
ncbi:MAG: 1-acyl-sn-glycerol-3-phosphate acyltransferase [Bacteroidales bacterium]|nr:1-acyl-sn-glycerol-3-phosphate acyltransferase [Bacteroidales bacterium]